jgi:hypothetical protein
MSTNWILILTGLVLLEVAERYRPWQERWRMYKRSLPEIYQTHRNGTAPRRPMWSYAVQALGLGLSVLGFWRLWSGA